MKKLLLIALLIVGCDIYDSPIPIEGCMDSNALNYDLKAEKDDGRCIYDTTPPSITSLTFNSSHCNYQYDEEGNYQQDVCTQEYSWTSFKFTAVVFDGLYGSGVDYVEAWIGYESLGKDYDGPYYTWDWNPSYLSEYEGNKTFRVKAYDKEGNYKQKTDKFYFIPYDN